MHTEGGRVKFISVLSSTTEGGCALVSVEVDRHPRIVHCCKVAVLACNHCGDDGGDGDVMVTEG